MAQDIQYKPLFIEDYMELYYPKICHDMAIYWDDHNPQIGNPVLLPTERNDMSCFEHCSSGWYWVYCRYLELVNRCKGQTHLNVSATVKPRCNARYIQHYPTSSQLGGLDIIVGLYHGWWENLGAEHPETGTSSNSFWGSHCNMLAMWPITSTLW